MRMMRKLLANLGDVWNTLPKEVEFLTIEKGAGTHTMVTVHPGALYFHSSPFRSELPVRQEIFTDGLTTAELLATINGMGYGASVTSEALAKGLNVYKPFILMEVQDKPLDTTLNAFTSSLWKTMYPIYRVLEEAEHNVDVALKQLYRDMASGEWLDFWASFFGIKREPGESDGNFTRRFTMWLFNPRTNNIALKELLSYRLRDNNIDVRDMAASQFEVLVGTKYLADASALHKILAESKAAGVEYFLNYIAEPYSEFYRLYWADKTGRPYNQNDEQSVQAMRTMEEAYVTPSEVITSRTMARVLEELFAQPSEEVIFQFQKPFEESAWVKPLDAFLKGMEAIYNENYPVPSEVQNMLMQVVPEEQYTGFTDQTNIDTCFTLNATEIRDVTSGELLNAGFSGMKDVATMTLSQSGVVTKRYVV